MSYSGWDLKLDTKCPALKSPSLHYRTIEALIISGRSRPPVADASVMLTLPRPPHAGAGAGDAADSRVVTTKTDAKGQYRVGPVSLNTAFAVQFSKQGFIFSPLLPLEGSATDFTAVKLGEITLLLLDEKNKPLKGILDFCLRYEIIGAYFPPSCPKENRVIYVPHTLIASNISPRCNSD